MGKKVLEAEKEVIFSDKVTVTYRKHVQAIIYEDIESTGDNFDVFHVYPDHR